MMDFFAKTRMCPQRQLGFSLIELLVAMFIATIIMAGVVNTIVTTKQSYTFDEQVSYMQENARFAVDLIARDFRQAGFLGGCNSKGNVALAISPTASQAPFIKQYAVEGFESGSHPAAYSGFIWTGSASTPDSVVVRFAYTEDNLFVNQHAAPTFTTNIPHGFSTGQSVLVADSLCSQVGISAMSATSTSTLAHNAGVAGSSTNCNANLTGNYTCSTGAAGAATSYAPGSRIFEYITRAYYIGDSSSDDTVPALFSTELNGVGAFAPNELVPGVEDIQITFGVDTETTDPDGKVNQYLTATGITLDEATAGSSWVGWDRVLTARIQMVVRSRDPILPSAQSQTPITGGATYNDRFMRQTVTTTIQMRNAALAANI